MSLIIKRDPVCLPALHILSREGIKLLFTSCPPYVPTTTTIYLSRQLQGNWITYLCVSFIILSHRMVNPFVETILQNTLIQKGHSGVALDIKNRC